MADVSRPNVDPESLLDYCRRAQDIGLTENDEFHSLLALLQGAQPPTQGHTKNQVTQPYRAGVGTPCMVQHLQMISAVF